MRIRQLIGLVLVVGVLGIVGCGGSDDKTATSSSSSKSDSSSSESRSSDNSSATGTGTGNGIPGAACIAAGLAYGKAVAAAGAIYTGQASGLQDSVDELQRFSNDAPSSVRDDIKTLAAAYAAFSAKLNDAGYDPSQGQPSSDQAEKIQQAADSLNTDELQQAGDRVSDYFANNCSG